MSVNIIPGNVLEEDEFFPPEQEVEYPIEVPDHLKEYPEYPAEKSKNGTLKINEKFERTFDEIKEKIIIDPGIGFGKRLEDNLVILRRLREFKSLGVPVLVGPSRKSFIGQILDLPVEERLEGTLGAISVCALKGADIVRVHDVREARRAIDVVNAIKLCGQNSK